MNRLGSEAYKGTLGRVSLKNGKDDVRRNPYELDNPLLIRNKRESYEPLIRRIHYRATKRRALPQIVVFRGLEVIRQKV